MRFTFGRHANGDISPWESLRYPKLLLLLLTIAGAYILFRELTVLPFYNILLAYWYVGAFLAGVCFVYGFTAAPATAVLLVLSEQGIVVTGLVAGAGALVGDLLVFRFVRHSFADELKSIGRWRFWLRFSPLARRVPERLRRYFLPVLAGFIIASPLPDEIGVPLLAASRNISTRLFASVSYLLNTAGIFVILYLGTRL